MSGAVVSGVAFLVVACALCLTGFGVLLVMGFERLHTGDAIRRDGLRAGTQVKALSILDADGREWTVPDGRWKFLVFINDSFSGFPEALHELRTLATSDPIVDVIVCARGGAAGTRYILRELGLTVPVADVDQEFFNTFRVRVCPYSIMVDGAGAVRFGRLTSTADTMLTAWRVGRLWPMDGRPELVPRLERAT